MEKERERERERERGVLRTMQRFFYDERTNEAKGEEDDRHVSDGEEEGIENHKIQPVIPPSLAH